MGGRALKPFYSSITSEVAMGSMPLNVDVKYLKNVENVGLVVNMCREYAGPVDEYAKLGILQVRLPTPDVCEPSYMDILRGVHDILEFLGKSNSLNSDPQSKCDQPLSTSAGAVSSNEDKIKDTTEQDQNATKAEDSTKKTVFIHCKAGRGRAAAMTLCYLLATTELPLNEAMRSILEARSVVEPYVKNFRVVRKFMNRLDYYGGDFEALFLHDYVLDGTD